MAIVEYTWTDHLERITDIIDYLGRSINSITTVDLCCPIYRKTGSPRALPSKTRERAVAYSLALPRRMHVREHTITAACTASSSRGSPLSLSLSLLL